MSIAVSGLEAMRGLCAQLDSRLRHNEDYRALKALEEAIAVVQGDAPEPVLPAYALAEPSLILPQIAGSVALPRVNGPSALMQRLSAHYGPFTTVQAAIVTSENPVANVTALAETLKDVLKERDAAA